VCTESQQGGLADANVDAFHYLGASAMAIHVDSIAREAAPSQAAERLLNTPTTDASVWGSVLPAAPQPVPAGAAASNAMSQTAPPPSQPDDDGFVLSLGKQGDGVALNWTGNATRLLKLPSPVLGTGACLAISGSSYLDPHGTTVPSDVYYEVGTGLLCKPGTSLAVGAASPASGSTMGGYTVTLLGAGFDTASKVKVGDFYATGVTVINGTTLTFRMVPGPPGPTTITVIDQAGRTATAPFAFVDPGEVSGGVTILAPADGAVVTSGSTIVVSAAGFGGYRIAGALVSSAAFASGDDQDPGDGFTAQVSIPSDVVGPLTIECLAKDAGGNLKLAEPVTVTVAVPGNVALVRLDAEPMTLQFATPQRQLHVHGVYTDGTRRDVTHGTGISYEMDTQDIRKPNYPYNGTGVAVVDQNGLVTAKTCGATVCHVTYNGLTADVVIEVAEVRPTLTLLRPGLISWPYQGPATTYDVIRGKLSALRATGGNYADPSIGTTCIKDNVAGVTAADLATPPTGDGYFYVMRESLARSYDEFPFWPTRSQVAVRTTQIAAAPNTCP
jgi:hypothetical protein